MDMLTSYRFLLLILSLVLTLCAAASLPDVSVQEEEKWLDDFETTLDEMVGDAPLVGMRDMPVPGLCPPVPRDKTTTTCLASMCKTDSDCQVTDQKCCHNGCVHTCLKKVEAAGYVDWRREPRRQQGSSWLVTGPEVVLPGKTEVEWCSTSEVGEDEDALLCPHGYVCHIEYLGNPERDEPNRGRCLKEKETSGPHYRKFRLKTEYHGNNVCMFENAIFADGASFMFHEHPCECKKKSIMCHVGKPEDTDEPESDVRISKHNPRNRLKTTTESLTTLS